MSIVTRLVLVWMGLAVMAGCSDDKKVTGKSGSKGGGDGPAVTSEDKEVEGVDSYQGVKGSGFVVKNYLQLKAATEACVGAGMGVVADDMFAMGRCGAGVGNPGGGDKLVILGADKCAFRNQNIFDVLKDSLWSPDLAGRTDTLANQLTPSYLQALATAADVVAHSVANPQELCGTKEKALELLGKCVAQFSPSSLDSAAEKIAEICAQGGTKSREAIATIIGSAAFASAAPKDGT